MNHQEREFTIQNQTREEAGPAASFLTEDETAAIKQDEITGLVLSMMDYKDQAGIISLATPETIVSVYAKGIQKTTSKNKRLANPFSKVRLVYAPQYSRDMLYLLRGSLEWYDYQINEDLLDQSVCFVLRDMLQSAGIDPFLYQALEACWHAFAQGRKESALALACAVAAGVLKREGAGMAVDCCTVCGSTQGIEGISAAEGGFVCQNCRDMQTRRRAKEELRRFRAFFKVDSDSLSRYIDQVQARMEDFLELCLWYQEYVGRNLASIRFLQTVWQMDAQSRKDR